MVKSSFRKKIKISLALLLQMLLLVSLFYGSFIFLRVSENELSETTVFSKVHETDENPYSDISSFPFVNELFAAAGSERGIFSSGQKNDSYLTFVSIFFEPGIYITSRKLREISNADKPFQEMKIHISRLKAG